jgi:predicted RNase H-like nuclease (RuvC/YqgF family)
MSIWDIINPWGALREARWLVAIQKREIEALYAKLGETERKASNSATDGLVIRVLRSKIERLEDTLKKAHFRDPKTGRLGAKGVVK